MIPILLSGPVIEPVSLFEAKNWLRLSNSDEDVLVQALITSARLVVEASAGVLMISQTWRLSEDQWPVSGALVLPLRPIASVDAIRVVDGQGNAAILPQQDYQADVPAMNGRLQFLKAPLAPGQKLSGIQIDVTAGFGAAAADVPAPLRQAILLLVARWFENRGDAAEDGRALPREIASLVSSWRAVRLT
jgi:uncharacterized phiE125 gp8 family phage protein